MFSEHRCLSLMLYFNIVLVFVFCSLLIEPLLADKGQTDGVCVSPGGRFGQFSFQGRPPRKAVKGPKDLTACRIFRKKTCCTSAQTHPILLSIRKLASEGEATQECLALWELLECSICDPRIGVKPGPPVICGSFCESVLQACADAYFSVDHKTQVLTPCSSKDTICGRATEWTSNGTEFCVLTGFSVSELEEGTLDLETSLCFDGRESMLSLDFLDTTQPPDISVKKNTSQLRPQMNFTELISWIIGGMVFTAAVFFLSKRRRHNYQQKQLALLRTKSMLEARVQQQSTVQASVSKKNRSTKKR